ncbi:MAG: hypothetical protein ACFE8G_02520 [Candidatus Hermodarchaeota archaeon]
MSIIPLYFFGVLLIITGLIGILSGLVGGICTIVISSFLALIMWFNLSRYGGGTLCIMGIVIALLGAIFLLVSQIFKQ